MACAASLEGCRLHVLASGAIPVGMAAEQFLLACWKRSAAWDGARAGAVLRSERGTVPEYVLFALAVVAAVTAVLMVLRHVSPETLDRLSTVAVRAEPAMRFFVIACGVLAGVFFLVLCKDRRVRRERGPGGLGSSF